MLTALDDTLSHVTSDTFDHANTTDHRFFDRYWFSAYDPSGRAPAINTGMCRYLNLNVMDGYAAIQHQQVQHNLRVSRSLRPGLETDDPFRSVVGALQIQVEEPFRRVRLVLGENEQDMSFDLVWSAAVDPYEEAPHFSRRHGRANQNYRRTLQTGTLEGWVRIRGQSFEADRWWGGRDHSWGVRPDVGGFEPDTGPGESLLGDNEGGMLGWLTASSPELDLHFQYQERSPSGERPYETAIFRPAGFGTDVRVPSAIRRTGVALYEGTRMFERIDYEVDVEAVGPWPAGTWKLALLPLYRPLVMKGLGYSMGFNDSRGFGAHRGESFVEHDDYELSHPEDVGVPGGETDRPYHRDVPVRVEAEAPNGAKVVGTGHSAHLFIGGWSAYGL